MLISTNSGLYSARPNDLRVPMAEAMDFFGRMGFEAVDVNFAASIYVEPEKHEPILDGDWQQNLDTVLAAIRRNNLAVSHTHLPFYNYEMEDKERLAFCDQMTYRAIDASAYIGAKYAVIHPGADIRELIKTMNTALNGRGGGRDGFAQGSVACTEDELRRFWA